MERVLDNLNELAFWKTGGPESFLKKIKENKGSQKGFKSLEEMLSKSEENVQGAAKNLIIERGKVSFEFGNVFAREINGIINQKLDMEKRTIRPRLWEFARQGRLDPDEADALLTKIKEFNDSLDALHDKLRLLLLQS
jgi:hypothetical protein